MTISLLHALVSAIPDSAAPGVVKPSNWNAEHSLRATGPCFLGVSGSGVAAVEELSASAALTLIKTVDGAGSGLDADLLDGKDTGTSGNVVPLLDGANTWSALQIVAIDDAVNSAVTEILRLRHTTTGSPAVGIGTRLAFETETSAGNNEIGGVIENVTTDVTGGSEDFEMYFDVMSNGVLGRALKLDDYGYHVFTAPRGLDGGISFRANDYAEFGVYSFNAAPFPTFFLLGARGTIASPSAVQIGDLVGELGFYGYDGNSNAYAARIQARVDGTPGDGDMPGRLMFSTTPDGSQSPAEALRIDAAQKVIFQVDRSPRFNNQTSAAGASAGTLGNAPAAGDPGFWLKINIGGTNYAIPCWAG